SPRHPGSSAQEKPTMSAMPSPTRTPLHAPRIMPRLATALIVLALGTPGVRGEDQPGKQGWIPLFNGKDLDGWTPKIKGYDLGENHAETFRVEDGVLKVAYDKYPQFDGKFGHLFYKSPYSHYRLRIEYRFVGEQCPGGPSWAFRN